MSQPKTYKWISNCSEMQNKLDTSNYEQSVLEVNWYPISPYVRFAQYDVVPPSRYKSMDVFIPQRVIFDYELMFVKSGHAIVHIENEDYEVQANDIVLFKPKQKHSIELIGDETFIQPHIHFDLIAQENSPDVFISFKKLEEMDEYERSLFRLDITDVFVSPFPNVIHLKKPYLVEYIIFEIVRLYESRQPFSQIAIQGLFLQLWYQLLVEIQGTQESRNKELSLIAEVKLYLEQNTNRTITLEELENHFFVNKYYISRLFQKKYKISLVQYHIRQRIQQAERLLNLTNLSVAEIAKYVGYNSTQRFSKVFKKLKGITPTEYRKGK